MGVVAKKIICVAKNGGTVGWIDYVIDSQENECIITYLRSLIPNKGIGRTLLYEMVEREKVDTFLTDDMSDNYRDPKHNIYLLSGFEYCDDTHPEMEGKREILLEKLFPFSKHYYNIELML